MTIDVQPYFTTMGYSNPDELGASFALEDNDEPSITYGKLEKNDTPRTVTPMRYKNCIGIIKLIIEFVITLLKKCFCGKRNKNGLPKASFKQESVKVVQKEVRNRNAKRSEVGIEYTSLVKKIHECVRQVNNKFTINEASAVALKVAAQWKKFSDASETGELAKVYAQKGKGTQSLKQVTNQQGYLMPQLVVLRKDEKRNKSLHATKLVIKMPVIERGIETEVTLFNGTMVGGTNDQKQDLVYAMEKESAGLVLELGNSKSVQTYQLENTVGTKDTHLLKSLTAAISTMGTELSPISNSISLTAKTSGTGKEYLLTASDLLVGRYSDINDLVAARQSKADVEAKAKLVLDGAKGLIKDSPYELTCRCTKAVADTKWKVQMVFTPKPKEK